MNTRTTDKGVGLALLCGLLALGGAGAMAAAAPDASAVSGAGFAAAVAFGCLAVVALHAYPE